MIIEIKEPTPEQCSNHDRVYDIGHKVGYAIWYPQMGGYVGKAVAVLDHEWIEHSNGSRVGGCIDVYVWHDGDFPFGDERSGPITIHHCDPDQFVAFGEKLSELNGARKKNQ